MMETETGMGRALRNPLILKYIFNYGDVATLKSARLCCRLWNEVATPVFKKKSIMVVVIATNQPSELHGEGPRITPLNNETAFYGDCKAQPSLHNFHSDFVFEVFNIIEFEPVLQFLGNKIKNLVLEIEKLSLKELETVLYLCPNLESLTLKQFRATSTSSDPIIFKLPVLKLKHLSYTCMDLIGNPESQLTQIFERTPQIESVHFSFRYHLPGLLEAPFKALVNAGAAVRNLSVLEFHCDVVRAAEIRLLSTLDVKLRRLEMSSLVERDEIYPALHELLSRHKLTLEYLTILILHGEVPIESIAQLSKLQKFRCHLKYDPFAEHIFTNSSAKDFDLGLGYHKCQHHYTKFYPNYPVTSKMIQGMAYYFIGLRKITLHLPEDKVITCLIQVFAGSALEEISLSLSEQNIHFDSAILGISPAEYEKKPTDYTLGYKAGIRNIKKLRRLDLDYEENRDSWYHDFHMLRKKKLLSYALFFCGLLPLKNLTNLRLRNFSIPDIYLTALLNDVPLMFVTLKTCLRVRDGSIEDSLEHHVGENFPGIFVKILKE